MVVDSAVMESPASKKLRESSKNAYSVIGSGDKADLNQPTGVAITSRCIFVTDTYNNRVQVFDIATYEVVASVDGSTEGKGKFKQPHGICADEEYGSLYVCDRKNHRIAIIDINSLKCTKSIGKYGKEGDTNEQLHLPQGIGIDKFKRHLYICDTKNKRVQVFHAESNVYIATIEGSLSEPTTVSVDETNQLLYICDWYDQILLVNTKNGQYIVEKIFTNIISPYGLCIIPCSNYIYITENNNKSLLLVNSKDFSVISALYSNTDDEEYVRFCTQNDLKIGRPREVAIDQNGTVYIADNTSNRIIICSNSSLPTTFSQYNTKYVFDQPLFSAMQRIVNTHVCSDLSLVLNNCTLKLPAHKVILYSRSSIFRSIIEGQAVDAMKLVCVDNNTEIHINDDNYNNNVESIEAMKTNYMEFLNFLYTDHCSCPSALLMHNRTLIKLGIRFDVTELIEQCEASIVGAMKPTTACDALVFAESLGRSRLLENVLLYIINNAKHVMQSEGFKTLIVTNPSLLVQVTSRLAQILP